MGKGSGEGGVGKVSPRLSCCGLQEQAQMGLELESAQMFWRLFRGSQVSPTSTPTTAG